MNVDTGWTVQDTPGAQMREQWRWPLERCSGTSQGCKSANNGSGLWGEALALHRRIITHASCQVHRLSARQGKCWTVLLVEVQHPTAWASPFGVYRNDAVQEIEKNPYSLDYLAQEWNHQWEHISFCSVNQVQDSTAPRYRSSTQMPSLHKAVRHRLKT